MNNEGKIISNMDVDFYINEELTPNTLRERHEVEAHFEVEFEFKPEVEVEAHAAAGVNAKVGADAGVIQGNTDLLINQNTEAVVVDAGSKLLKAGFAALDQDPPLIIPTKKKSVVKDWDTMEDLPHHVLYHSLGGEIGEEGQILLTDPLSMPKAIREQLVQLMFETFDVSGFYAPEQAVLSLYAVGRISDCTVDIGHGKIDIAPVCEGAVQHIASKRFEIGGIDLTKLLAQELHKSNPLVKADLSDVEKLKEIVVDNLFEICLVVIENGCGDSPVDGLFKDESEIIEVALNCIHLCNLTDKWNPDLGGKMESSLMKYFADEFNKHLGNGVGLIKSPKSMGKLKEQVNCTTEILGANTATPTSVELLYEENGGRRLASKGDMVHLVDQLDFCLHLGGKDSISFSGGLFGNWPLGIIAIEKTKSVFLKKIGENLQNHWGMFCTTNEVMVVEELLWFISSSTNVQVLQEKNIHIWDGNVSRECLDSIGVPFNIASYSLLTCLIAHVCDLVSGDYTEAKNIFQIIEQLPLKLCHSNSIILLRTEDTLLKILVELNDWKGVLAYCKLTIPALQYYTFAKLEWLFEHTENALNSFTTDAKTNPSEWLLEALGQYLHPSILNTYSTSKKSLVSKRLVLTVIIGFFKEYLIDNREGMILLINAIDKAGDMKYSSHSLEEVTAMGRDIIFAFESKSMRMDEALQIFNEIETKDIVCWNTMVSGYATDVFAGDALIIMYARCGSISRAEQVFSEMEGMVEDGLNLFNLMNIDYSVLPVAERYACGVDLFGRAGRLEQGYLLGKRMPIGPNAGIWGALLGACRIYLNPDIADIAAEKLFEFEPHQTSNYVGLSSIHAEACYRYALELHLCKSLWHFIFDPGGGRHMVAYLEMFLDGSFDAKECRHIDLVVKVKSRGKD